MTVRLFQLHAHVFGGSVARHVGERFLGDAEEVRFRSIGQSLSLIHI